MRLSLLFVASIVMAAVGHSASAQNTTPHGSVPPAHVSAYSGGSPQSTAVGPQRPVSTQQPPAVMYECDQNNCAQIGGIWVFQENRGQAMWNVASESATLTIKQFDGTHIVIDRVDPPDAAGSRNLVGGGGSLRVEYTGTISGNRIEGTAVWDKAPGQPYPWSASITKEVCDGGSCPLTADQRMSLGINLFNDRLYVAAFDVFMVDEDINADAKGFAAFCLALNGTPAKATDERAFGMAKGSAGAGSGVGMVVLGRFYKSGVGTPVNAALGDQWEQRGTTLIDAQAGQEQQNTSSNHGIWDMMDTFFPPSHDRINCDPGFEGSRACLTRGY